jgi:O-antigen/teichoic acid export membrane protein
MTNKSIKNNFAYNTILKLLNIIFPLITFPYVARVLSPTGIGKVDFSMSIIQYFILIAQLGIPTYAIRECAKIRDNKEKLVKTVQEILGINFLALLLSYVLFAIVILNVEQLASYRNILLIGSINILSTSIGLEWFYQAIEEYKYITVRSIFVKVISLVAIFVFIKDQNDILVYAFITVLSTSLAYIYNFFHLKKHINIYIRLKDYNFKRHLKPVFLLFAMSLSVSIYINLDKIMLGFLSGVDSVGLYTAANKMVKVILTLVTSLGTVLLPRMSYYIENNEVIQVKRLINKSLNFIMMISIPSTIGIVMLAEPIIYIFAGQEYLESIRTIKIISPIIIAIVLSNLIGIQILVSHGKERFTLISTIVGAVINFSFNLVFIPIWKQNGAALGTLIAEISVTILQFFYAYTYIKGNISWKSIFTYLLGGFLIILTTGIINYITTSMMIFTVLSVILSIFTYFVFLYLAKNELVYEIVDRLFIKLKKKQQ